MLLARDNRAQRQRELIDSHRLPLLCLTMNIPGNVKNTNAIGYAFYEGVQRIRLALGNSCVHQLILDEITGFEGYFVIDRAAKDIKALAVEMESDSLGRLFDMDVLGIDYKKLERTEQRQCLICKGPAACCARSRAHNIKELTDKINSIIINFAAEDLKKRATQALVEEARFSPKPGLVDSNNCGAHSDMDLGLMERSARALEDWFLKLVMAGYNNKSATELRQIGILAEQAMQRATGGVNTHRGAIYTLGLLLCGWGRWLSGCEGTVFDIAAALANELDAKTVPTESHGFAVRQKYGALGARGEAAGGFKSVKTCMKDLNNGKLFALLRLLSTTADSNVLYRSGTKGQSFLRDGASAILNSPKQSREALTRQLDLECIKRGISPGGCADIFAAAIFMQGIANRHQSCESEG